MKKNLRDEILGRRKILDKEEKKHKDKKIYKTLVNSSLYKKCDNIFTYISFGGEVDTKEIIEKAFLDGKNVYVPVTKADGFMKFVQIEDFSELEKTPFGTLEPFDDNLKEEIPRDDYLFIVPGVAFDRNGNRVGYGKGYYDRYFYNHEVFNKIGLAYDFQIKEDVFAMDWDEKVDIIITETETIRIS